ncbi:DUF5753 domain-containing protein [Amycolatopsis sp. NPDC059021]|uniref:DUF5753 domain-containing protein n=1 Tax=Amycolatopsis sp. NPDC059021 TaxID=3346704 RepID=UPI003671C193
MTSVPEGAVAPLLIPGILQTTDVIRAIMVAAEVPASEIGERVTVRVGRRNMITRKDPAHLEVLLGEVALRKNTGGRQVWADQLRYLLELSELPNIDIRVIPTESGWTPADTGAFIVLDSGGVEPTIVNVELQGAGLILHDEADVETHRKAAASVRKRAMSAADTQKRITEVLKEWESYDDVTA